MKRGNTGITRMWGDREIPGETPMLSHSDSSHALLEIGKKRLFSRLAERLDSGLRTPRIVKDPRPRKQQIVSPERLHIRADGFWIKTP